MAMNDMAPEDMAELIANLRTEVFTANQKAREEYELRIRAEAAVEALNQPVLEREEARGFEQAQERHVSRIDRRRQELKAELARLDEQA
jgi:hypothetical protein